MSIQSNVIQRSKLIIYLVIFIILNKYILASGTEDLSDASSHRTSINLKRPRMVSATDTSSSPSLLNLGRSSVSSNSLSSSTSFDFLFKKAQWTGKPLTSEQSEHYDSLRREPSKKPVSSIIRTDAWIDKGRVRGSGEHEVFKTSETKRWQEYSTKAGGTTPDGKPRAQSVNIGGKRFKWLDAQATIRARTDTVIFPDGSAHAGALYAQPKGGGGSRIQNEQPNFHTNQFNEINRSSNPLSAAQRGVRFQINGTMNARDFHSGTVFKKRSVSGVFDTYDNNLTDDNIRGGSPLQRHMDNRNKLKYFYKRIKQLNNSGDFRRDNAGIPSSIADSATVSKPDVYSQGEVRKATSEEQEKAEKQNLLLEELGLPPIQPGDK